MPNQRSENSDRVELPILTTGGENPPPKETKSQSKSGRGRIRAAVLILVHFAILLHIGHYFFSGRSISPVEPSEAMYTIELGYINAGAIFFGIAILSTAIFGRFFCGWGCHIVALQDLCSYVLRRVGIRTKPLRSRLLVWVPFAVAFYMFFWPTVKRIWYGNRHPGFTNHLLTENFWATFPGPVVAVVTFIVCGSLIVYLLGNKGFCTYACPYGAFFSISDVLAIGRIRVTDDCHQCGQCTAHCTSNVFVHSEVKEFGMVIDSGCMKCMDCVSVCPNDALYYGFSPKTVLQPPAAIEVSSQSPRRKKTYDFSIVEELMGLAVTAFVVFALRGLYDLIPLLLSVALGVMTAYLFIQFWRIFRKRDLRIQNFQIKRDRRLTGVGRWVVVLLCIWFTVNVQSFVVQYFRQIGARNIAQIEVNWGELMIARTSPEFSPEQHVSIDAAIKNLGITDQIGLLPTTEVKMGLAVAYKMKGNLDAAEKYLRQAYQCKPWAVREVLMEFLVAQGRTEDARRVFESSTD